MPTLSQDFRHKTRFIVKLGIALHESGATSQRVERHLLNVTHQLGLHGSFLISPTTFTCAFWEQDELDQFIHIERIQPADNNLGLLDRIDQLMDALSRGEIDLQTAEQSLLALRSAPPHYSTLLQALSWALIGGSFAALLSPHTADIIASTLLALLLFLFARTRGNHAQWGPILTLAAPFFSAIAATALARLGGIHNAPFVILSSVVIFIPGLALTVALTEISARDLISGTSRLVDATMLLLKLFFGSISGIAVGSLLAPWLRPLDLPSLPELPGLRIWPAVVGLSVGIGIAFNLAPKRLPSGLAASFVAFLTAHLAQSHLGMFAGMFLGALAVGLYANGFSRLTGSPASIPMMQGLVLLVPGSKTYMLLNQWMLGTAILPGSGSATQALMTFLCLVSGLMIANALVPSRKSL